MKSVFYTLLLVMVVVISATIFIKTANHFIKAVDPLAQQIAVLDNARSPEVVKIKGELMRDLVKAYYSRSDSAVRK